MKIHKLTHFILRYCSRWLLFVSYLYVWKYNILNGGGIVWTACVSSGCNFLAGKTEASQLTLDSLLERGLFKKVANVSSGESCPHKLGNCSKWTLRSCGKNTRELHVWILGAKKRIKILLVIYYMQNFGECGLKMGDSWGSEGSCLSLTHCHFHTYYKGLCFDFREASLCRSKY